MNLFNLLVSKDDSYKNVILVNSIKVISKKKVSN